MSLFHFRIIRRRRIARFTRVSPARSIYGTHSRNRYLAHKEAARAIVHERVDHFMIHYGTQHGIAVGKIAIRNQKSRWGSCSTTGVLSYSWRLILAPPFVLDYLAAHEAAHLVEMNHSRAFWRQVERICPDMDRAKAWLDVHGTGLHRFGMPDKAR